MFVIAACADLVAVTGGPTDQSHGECPTPVDDSGTESGEDFRLLSPEILAEVQSALTRLETALPGLDPSRREALVRLVTRLQACLKLQPPVPPPPQAAPTPPQPPVRRYANRRQRSQRHTVGVSKEELADARRWLQETRSQASSGITPEPSVEILTKEEETTQGFRPVKFNPTQSKEYPPADFSEPEPFDPTEDTGEVVISAQLSYALPTQEVQKADSGSSLLEYDPSLALFTPSQSVQIAVHKAAINKQISQEESKREHNKREESYDSEDGDVSSVEEEMATGEEGLEDAISSAQRLLQIASDGNKKSSGEKYHDRNSKKQKMKRANTIDIPKPPNFYDLGHSSDERDEGHLHHVNGVDRKVPPPAFKPKSESDLKFLAFLHEANKNEAKASTYNPSARGGAPWSNRFVNLKTAFESGPTEVKETPKKKTSLPTVFQMWENTAALQQLEEKQNIQKLNNKNRKPQPLQNKLPWSSQQEENGVVIGSLTVKPSPGTVNKFSHAPKSAFKPIEKKPVSYVQPQKLIIQPQPKPVSKTAQFQRGKSFEEITYKVAEPPQQPLVTKLAPSVSGTVKQLATQKFSGESIPAKPVIKQYPVIQDKQFNAINAAKHHPFVEQVAKPIISSGPIHQNHPSLNFAPSIASAQKQFNHPDPIKPIKIPQKPAAKVYKDGSEYSPPKQYINSPPLSKPYTEPFEYPSETKFNNSFPNVINHEKRVETPELPQEVSVPYYSQIPAFVQHSTYAQPQISTLPQIPFHQQDFQPRPESVEAYTPKFSQQNHSSFVPEELPPSHKIADGYTNGNVSPFKIQTNNDSFVASNIKYEEPVYPQHRFTEESLVPNPLNLSQVVRPVHLDFVPFEPPVRPPPILQPLIDVSLLKPVVPTITNNLYENNSSQGSLNSSKLSDSSSSIKQFLNIPYDSYQDVVPAVSHTSKSPYLESGNSSGAASPQWNTEEIDENDHEISVSEGTEIQTAVARVMGQQQCQKAVTVMNRTQRRFEEDKSESQNLLRTLLKSPNSPTNMPRRPSSEKLQNYTDSYRPPKSPLLDDSPRFKSVPENRVQPNATNLKPPVIITPQSKPISSAASAFRPLVNNYSKPTEADYHRLPPVPTSPTVNRKLETENQYKQMHSSNKVTQNSLSSKYYSSELSSRNTSSVSPSRSPSFPNVLQKSESWHQLVKDQMSQGRHPPPKSPRLSKTKSSHTLAFPKQYEAHLTPETLAVKQSTVDQYLKSPTKQLTKSSKQTYKQKKTVNVVKLDDNLDNVDEAFESLFQEVAKKK